MFYKNFRFIGLGEEYFPTACDGDTYGYYEEMADGRNRFSTCMNGVGFELLGNVKEGGVELVE